MYPHNCICQPNNPDPNTTALGEHYNLVTIKNNMEDPVEVFWVGIGWHCSTMVYKATPFICYHTVLAPGESYTYNIKGYANTVAAQDPKDPRRSCGGPDMFEEGKRTVTTSSMLKASSKSCSSLFGVVCDILNLAYDLPWGIGSIIKSIVKGLGGLGCPKTSTCDRVQSTPLALREPSEQINYPYCPEYYSRY